MFKKMFDKFDLINSELDNDITEISIKQSQIVFSFQYGAITMHDLKILDEICHALSITEVAAFQDTIHVRFANLSRELFAESLPSPCPILTTFYELIFHLQDVLCTCPALEYVISDSYLKVYIDLPNVHVKDIAQLDEMFQAEGVIELNNQRPYVLYVKDW